MCQWAIVCIFTLKIYIIEEKILSSWNENLNCKFSFSFEVSTQENCLFLNILYDNLLKFASMGVKMVAAADNTDWTF